MIKSSCKCIGFIGTLLLTASIVFADTQTVDGVTYTYSATSGVARILNSDGVIVSSGAIVYSAISTNTAGEVVVPDRLGGCPVEIIGRSAFAGCKKVTSIKLPESVTWIDDNAFASCTNLTSLKMPDGVRVLGEGAFYRCRKLTAIAIPNSVSRIGYGAFSECDGLTSIWIPKRVEFIKDYAFSGCRSLRRIDVDLDNPHFSSQDGVLFDKAGLKLLAYPAGRQGAYVIPERTKSIDDGAFRSCVGLTALIIPKSIREMRYASFGECSNLLSAQISPENPNYSCRDGVLFNKDGTTLIRYIVAPRGAYSIPDGTKIIEGRAFAQCGTLTSVTFPNSVEKIGDSAFLGCSSLTFAKLPERLSFLPWGLFYGCENLTSVVMPKSLNRISKSAFNNCYKLRGIVIPDDVMQIDGAFDGCLALTNISIPKGITYFGRETFNACDSLTSITIPANVKRLGPRPFSTCRGLKEIIVDADNPNYRSIDGVLFNKDATCLLRCPSGRVGVYAVPATVETIEADAFKECWELTSLSIPPSVTNIAAGAFWCCYKITSVTIPPCVTDLKLTFPNSYETITNVVRHAAIQ